VTKPSRSRTFAECVGGILTHNGKVLVEKRRADDEADPGLIVLPGGHVDKGESLEQALIREMREELGIQIDRMKPVLTRIYTASNGERQRIHYFHIEKWRGDIKSNEAESVDWESFVGKLHDAPERKIVRKLMSQSTQSLRLVRDPNAKALVKAKQ
jgi:8-oxo-dGTP diphosphatase